MWGRRWRRERSQAMRSLGKQDWIDRTDQTKEPGWQLEAAAPWVLLAVGADEMETVFCRARWTRMASDLYVQGFKEVIAAARRVGKVRLQAVVMGWPKWGTKGS